MMVVVLALLLVEEPGPIAESDGMAGPFMKTLAKELRAGAAKMNRFGFSASPDHRSDPAVLLHVGSGGVGFPHGTKGRQQPRCERRPSSGKGIEDREIGMAGCRLGNLLLQFRDALPQGSDQVQQTASHGDRRLDHGRIANGGNGLANVLDAPLDELGVAAVVPPAKRPDGVLSL